MTKRLPIVGVMGASDRHLDQLRQTDPGKAEQSLDRARQLGRSLANLPVHLLTGGGGGMMKAVCEGFASVSARTGKIVGVIPGPERRSGYPNDYVEIVIRTHLPGQDPTAETSRNHINILTSDAVIALPGGPGTAAEVQLATRYQRPLALHLSNEESIGGKTTDDLTSSGFRILDDCAQVSNWLREVLPIEK